MSVVGAGSGFICMNTCRCQHPFDDQNFTQVRKTFFISVLTTNIASKTLQRSAQTQSANVKSRGGWPILLPDYSGSCSSF